VVYPNRRAVGTANLGFQAVVAQVAGHPGYTCHRAFADHPRTLEAGRGLDRYDLVALSLSFEGDYPAALEMLAAAGIPLRARDRDGPLVLAGGVAPTLNPEPLAPFVDVVLVGEAEAGLGALLDLFLETRSLTRPDRLAALARAALPGVYVPSAYRVDEPPAGPIVRRAAAGAPERVARVWVPVPWDPARTRIWYPDDVFQGAYLLEVSRGCPHGCRFCAAGYATRPPRFLPVELLEPLVRQGAGWTGRVGLVGAAVSDHPGFADLARCALDAGATFTVSSFRAENLTPEAVELLARGGTRTLTVALEAGSPRLRALLGKTIGDQDLLEAARLAGEAGIRNLRVYAMVGLPTETDDDVGRLADLAVGARRALGSGTVTLSVAPFVPKPHTPLQWEPMAPEPLLRRRIRLLESLCGRHPGVRAVAEAPKWARVQGLLSRGGRSVAPLLEQAVRTGDWRAVLRTPLARAELDEPRSPASPLPWDFLDGVPGRDALLRERDRGLRGLDPLPCRPGHCRLCGVCSETRN